MGRLRTSFNFLEKLTGAKAPQAPEAPPALRRSTFYLNLIHRQSCNPSDVGLQTKNIYTRRGLKTD